MQITIDVITSKILKFLSYFQYNAVVTLSYFFICLLVLLLDYITKKKSTNLLFTCYRDSIFNPLTYVRLFTHSLGHANWKHFTNNFFYILLIGPMIEEKYGSINLLYMMLLTSFIIGIIHITFKKTKLLGASGILYMMIVLSSFVNIQNGKIPLTLVLIILFHIIDEVIDLIKGKKEVSHLGHLVGAICGGVIGFYFL